MKYQTIIRKKEISKILENGDLRESYNTRVNQVETAKENGNKKPSKKRSNNLAIEKKAKNGSKDFRKNLEKRLLLERMKIMKEHITDKLKESRATKTSNLAEAIKN